MELSAIDPDWALLVDYAIEFFIGLHVFISDRLESRGGLGVFVHKSDQVLRFEVDKRNGEEVSVCWGFVLNDRLG